MDPITSNFVLNIVGIGVGSLIAIIAAVSSCMQKSRCTSINSPCMSCERTLLEVNETIPPTPEQSFTTPTRINIIPPPKQTKI